MLDDEAWLPASRPKAKTSLPLGKLLILAVALGSAGAGVIHLGVAGQHLDHAFLVASFLAMGLAQVALAGTLVVRPSRTRLAAIALLNLGILALWGTTRLIALPFVPGLESAQPIGIADMAALLLETGGIVAAAMGLVLPRAAARSLVAGGQRVVVAVASVVLALTVPGLIAPHSHPGGHGHGSSEVPAQHGHPGDAAAPGPHEHGGPLSWDEATTVLSHDHGSSAMSPVGSHAHELQAGHQGHAPEATGGHDHSPSTDGPDGSHQHDPEAASKPETVLLAGENWRFAYEPPTEDGEHSAAFRYSDGSASHHHGGSCTPTAVQAATADRLVREMRKTLTQYDNNPWEALSDGFIAYPIPLSKMFHMVAVGRYYDGKVVYPSRVESFLYAMTDEGLTAVGGMFIFPFKDKTPPNPTGCLMIWHKHTRGEGLVTSFDPRSPDESVWMAHVWTYGGLEPWGRDMDGSEPHAWFFGYRYLPVVCNDNGECF